MPTLLAVLTIAVGSWIHIAGGSWEPSPQDIAKAAASLQPYVAEQASIQHQKLPDWSTYSFQFQGKEVSGYKLIYVNAFCEPPPDYAKKKLVLVADGGPCYFSAYYDPRTKKFVGINFNGFA